MINNISLNAPSHPGYQPAIPFRYPKRVLNLVAVVLLIGLTPLLLLITAALQGGRYYVPAVTSLAEGGIVFATIIGTVLIHEFIHGLAYQALGYRVTYGASLRLLAAYAGAFGQWQQRNHNIVVALAPVVVLTPLFLILLAGPTPTLVLIGFTGLLFNSAGAVGDFYLTARLLAAPPRTLLYDLDPHTMFMLLPER